MKFAAIIEYGPDPDRVKCLHPAHRQYLRTFLESGQLRAAGPFADAGAFWVLDAETADAAEEIVRGDSYVAAGVILRWVVRPLAYWSAQEAKGARCGPQTPTGRGRGPIQSLYLTAAQSGGRR
jgi:uncharacterized protein